MGHYECKECGQRYDYCNCFPMAEKIRPNQTFDLSGTVPLDDWLVIAHQNSLQSEEIAQLKNKLEEALSITEKSSSLIDALFDRITELELENMKLREHIASTANRVNVVGSPYHRALEALDEIVSELKLDARKVLKDGR